MGSINYDIGSASVEWFEQGETKGKEIDLLLIEALNPDIRIVRPTNHAIEQQELRQTEEPIVIIDVSLHCLGFCCSVPGTIFQTIKSFISINKHPVFICVCEFVRCGDVNF